jgi:hypothetical protein
MVAFQLDGNQIVVAVSVALANALAVGLLSHGSEVASLLPSCIVPLWEAPQYSIVRPQEDTQMWCNPFYSS